MKNAGLVLILSFGFVLLGHASFVSAEVKQYTRRVRDPNVRPGDAAEKVVLEVEEDRELVSEGNITRVEGTDDYIGKEMDGIRSRVDKLEQKMTGIQEKIAALESKMKRARPVAKDAP